MDSNSGYFHKVATGKRNKNIIRQITDQNGINIIGKKNVKKEITAEFRKRFESVINISSREQSDYLDLISPQISNEENEFLTQPITNNEVKAIIFQMGNDKSPGPDGFPAEFYKQILGNSGTSSNKSC